MHHTCHPYRPFFRQFLRVLAVLGGLAPGLLLPATASQTDSTIAGVATIVDGDTLEIHGQRIRLHAIDAPESGQTCERRDGSRWRCGQRAALALADKVGRGTVTCVSRDRDRYGRIVAVCRLQGEDLNRWMVAQGWAVAYRRFGNDYAEDEDRARAAGRGIWSGSFMMPWDWRRQ